MIFLVTGLHTCYPSGLSTFYIYSLISRKLLRAILTHVLNLHKAHKRIVETHFDSVVCLLSFDHLIFSLYCIIKKASGYSVHYRKGF